MRRYLITATLLMACLPLSAQNSRRSSLELLLQTRALHHFQSGSEESFRIKSDLGIGIRWVATISPQLQLTVGGQVNHGVYEKSQVDADALYYIDFFKSQTYNYFNLINVAQWTAEIPLSIRRSFFNLGKSKIGGYVSGSPQLFLSSEVTGIGLDGEEDRSRAVNSTNLPLDYYPDETKFITDFYASTGAFLTTEILNKRSLFLETGYEYSNAGKSSGLIIKMGIGF